MLLSPIVTTIISTISYTLVQLRITNTKHCTLYLFISSPMVFLSLCAFHFLTSWPFPWRNYWMAVSGLVCYWYSTSVYTVWDNFISFSLLNSNFPGYIILVCLFVSISFAILLHSCLIKIIQVRRSLSFLSFLL